jgi:MoxR-like ATPase
MENVILRSGKTCLVSEKYSPDSGMLSSFQGRDRELKMIFASWIARGRYPPLCPLMVGEPGVGKNRIVYELAALTGLDLFIMQGHEDITVEDLACSVRFSDDKERRMDYVLSPLVTAMHRGHICFIDEIGKIRPRALALLVSVLDERRYIDSTLLGERVYAAPSFRFVAATNTGEVSSMPEFIRSRMRPIINVGYPTDRDINEMIKNHPAVSPDSEEKIIDEFRRQWERQLHSPTPRDVIQLFALATTLSEYEIRGERALVDRNSAAARAVLNQQDISAPIEPRHIRDAFKELFPHGAS